MKSLFLNLFRAVIWMLMFPWSWIIGEDLP